MNHFRDQGGDRSERNSTRVSLVDDPGVARLMWRRSLEDLGFKHIVEARDGEKSLVKLNEALLIAKPCGL